MKKVLLNCGLSVCDNDYMSMIEGCPNNELLELLKTKKHARIFVHMLKKRKPKENLKKKCQSNRNMEREGKFLFEGQKCLSHASLFVHIIEGV